MEQNKLEIHPTADGSPTLVSSRFSASYHSLRGALTESEHVFISAGLQPLLASGQPVIRVAELGLGTMLNAALTLEAVKSSPCRVYYQGIEAYPPDADLILRYAVSFPALRENFGLLLAAEWGRENMVIPNFTFCPVLGEWPGGFEASARFDLFYWDAFAPSSQPELWTSGSLASAAAMLKPGGIWVSYCSKGEVRRTLAALGFRVEKLPGPPGKREMVRAFRGPD
jgi:tRNA U34 5-methylaminomethyl-2-thiouridine-forming methyltransferase MnmC